VGRWAGYLQLSFGPPFTSERAIQQFVSERTIRPPWVRNERRYVSLLDEFETNAKRIERERPDVVQGYGSYIGPLFRHLVADGRRRHRPRVVTYSSDTLPESDRLMLEEELGIPVLGCYQAVEALKIAFECGAGPWMHVNEDLYPVRIVDEEGATLPEGEPGGVVISNLVNRATVLLNYRLGDRARLLPGPCPCGRHLPRISLLEGREDDWIALPSGHILHPQAVRNLLADEAEILEFQVVQEGLARFRVNLVVDTGADREDLKRRLESKFVGRLGHGTDVAVAFVDALARTPGGKVRGFIRQPGLD
jgi:phenylacetate-CoA ligase